MLLLFLFLFNLHYKLFYSLLQAFFKCGMCHYCLYCSFVNRHFSLELSARLDVRIFVSQHVLCDLDRLQYRSISLVSIPIFIFAPLFRSFCVRAQCYGSRSIMELMHMFPRFSFVSSHHVLIAGFTFVGCNRISF